MGYKTVAIEQCFDHSKKENVKRSSDIFPEPVNIKWLIEEFKNKLKILQRLTIVYMDVAVAHAMVRKGDRNVYHLSNINFFYGCLFFTIEQFFKFKKVQFSSRPAQNRSCLNGIYFILSNNKIFDNYANK